MFGATTADLLTVNTRRQFESQLHTAHSRSPCDSVGGGGGIFGLWTVDKITETYVRPKDGLSLSSGSGWFFHCPQYERFKTIAAYSGVDLLLQGVHVAGSVIESYCELLKLT